MRLLTRSEPIVVLVMSLQPFQQRIRGAHGLAGGARQVVQHGAAVDASVAVQAGQTGALAQLRGERV